MAGTGVGKFSSTAGSNTGNMTVNFAENMAPSNVNNAARELMGHIRDMYEQIGYGYFEFGDGDGTYTIARVDADTLTIASAADLSATYFAGRKIRVTDGGANVVEGTIASTSHGSSLQTINMDGTISLASGTPTKVELGIDTAAFCSKIIFDDDGDTYMESAAQDDTIDIYVAGAKDFVITANTFTAESGSAIVTPTLTVSSAVTLPAGATNIATLDIDGGTDIGEAIVDADLFIIDNGAGGTNRKVTASRLKTYAASAAFTEAVTITVADNLDTLTLTSTDADENSGPNLKLARDSGSPADGDVIGQIMFTADDDAGNATDFFTMSANIRDASNGNEEVQMTFYGQRNGAAVNYLEFDDDHVVFNEGSADIDFRVESNGLTHMIFVDAGNDVLYLGGSVSSGGAGSSAPKVQINDTSNADFQLGKWSANADAAELKFLKSRNGTVGSNTIVADDDVLGNIMFFADDGGDYATPAAAIYANVDGTPGANDMPGRIVFATTADGANSLTERARIDRLGNVFVRTTNTTPGYGNTVQGQVLRDTGAIYASSYQAFHSFNRSNDGTVIALSSAGGEEGLISISGSTTSYGAFTGSHWSRLADNSKPSILRGTIIESLDTMMDWYQAEADVAEVTDEKGNVTPAYKVKEAITLPDGKSVGDAVTFISNGVEHTGVYIKEDDVKHVKCKVSDTADSTKVYGLFHCWDDQDDGLDGDVNDMEVAQVGTYIIRVHKDVTVSAGDLLVSNGDGTAKKQDDDIIRSKTVAKVNSNVKVETYADGSYTVPCTLHC